VRNIVSAHVDKVNPDSKFWLKVGFYTLAVVAFYVLNSHDYPTAGWGVMLAIALLTLICLGFPRYVWGEDIKDDLVPDAVYVAIEPGLMTAFQSSLAPNLKVWELIEVERTYHKVKKITSLPGYRGLKPDEPESN
jgi:hypothetical protein